MDHSAALLSKRSGRLIAMAILLVVTVLAYLPAIRGQFIWDDDRHVSQNRTLLDLRGLGRIWKQPEYLPQWYPLTHTSFWIEHQLWQNNPLGYHLDNVLLHVVNATLLLALCVRLKMRGAMLAAVVFCLHPIEVESVAWISERKNLLSTCMALLAVLAYLPVDSPAAPSTISIGRYVLATALFVAALLAKTVACSTPAVILLLLWWKRRASSVHIIALTPWFVIGGALAAFTAHTEVASVGAHGVDWDLSPLQRMLIAGRAVWFYAGKLVVPVNLTFSYPPWNVDPHRAWLFAFPLTAIGVAAALYCLRHRIGRGAVTAAVVFGGVLVPALGFVNTYPMRYSFVADHFQYAAGMALIAGAATFAGNRLPLTIGMGLVLATLTFRQARAYSDPFALWEDVLAKNDRSWMARQNLAVCITLDANATPPQLARAIRLFEETYQLRPQHEKLQANWGMALFRAERWDDALAHLALAPQTAAVKDYMGQALVKLHRLPEAEAKFRSAVAHNAGRDATMHLADTLAADGQDEQALAVYRTIGEQPASMLAMAAIYERLHRPTEAGEQLQRYLAVFPRDAAVHERLGLIDLDLTRYAAASREFAAALEIDPRRDTSRAGLLRAARSPATQSPATQSPARE